MVKQILSILVIVLIGIVAGALIYFFYPENWETTTVTLFWGNKIEDPEGLFCERVYPLERKIKGAIDNGVLLAVEELLKGPDEEEMEKGFFTAINPGVKVQNLIIENKNAVVDFDETLGDGVGGSCMVGAIRAQITETLKYFPEIDNVIISIDNRIEDILQP
ncbi:GerMN domain-containing protein [Patescibacteria group bacterium]|nr:GerMN domain-containing protein [Patescibacteria group bacterium]MBU4023000.1 GerMN domain-containing protein [Patescibacteria group bacterium]MBU4162200.1 GerMN domain-containing protein [Patescibacteria group bacterium]